MQVIVHTGAHHTDEERLLKCLLNNKEDFSQRGIAVPGPGKYRTLLKDAFAAMDNAEPAPDARNVLMDAILDDEDAERLILSNPNFFGSQRFALGEGRLYPLAPRRMRQLQRLFHPDGVSLFMAICNPAIFVPNVLSRASHQQQMTYLDENPPTGLRWSDLLLRLRDAVPDVRLTVWCYEDIPLLWADIIREFAGLAPNTRITGGFDLISELMSREGMQRFRAYLHRNRNLTGRQKRKVIAAFLDKYAVQDALTEELDFPNWTDALIDELTELYDEDVRRIKKMKGVRLLLP